MEQADPSDRPRVQLSCAPARSLPAGGARAPGNPATQRRLRGIRFAPYVEPVRASWLILLCATLFPGTLPAAVAPVAITGSRSPLGLPFSAFRNVTPLGDGRVVFVGSSTGAFRRVGSIVHAIAVGDVLTDATTVAGVSAPALGPGGCVAVRAVLVGGGARILRRCSGLIDSIAQRGDVVSDGSIVVEPVDDVAYGSGGHIAFAAVLADGSTALLEWTNGTLAPAVRTGTTAPNGGTFTTLRLVGVTADGRVGFRGAVANGRDGLFLWSGDRLRRVVEVGEASPTGGTFASVGGAS